LEVANATAFVNSPDVQDAVVSSVMNITSVPEEFITIDMEAVVDNPTRRLSSTRFLSTSSKVMLTYAGSVQGDAQPTPTGTEVADALMSTTADDFASVLSNTIDDILMESSFAVNVVDKSDVSLTLFDSSETSTSTTSQGSHPQITVTQSVDSLETPTSTILQESRPATVTYNPEGLNSSLAPTSTTLRASLENPTSTALQVSTPHPSVMESPDRDGAAGCAALSLAQGLAFIWILFLL